MVARELRLEHQDLIGILVVSERLINPGGRLRMLLHCCGWVINPTSRYSVSGNATR